MEPISRCALVGRSAIEACVPPSGGARCFAASSGKRFAIADAIVGAAKEVGFEVPLVVRLEGTNVDAARRLLEDAKSEIPTMRTAGDLADAAKTVCAAVAG